MRGLREALTPPQLIEAIGVAALANDSGDGQASFHVLAELTRLQSHSALYFTDFYILLLLVFQGAAREKLILAFRKWLALDPKERPSMAEVAKELDMIGASSTGVVQAVPAPTRLTRRVLPTSGVAASSGCAPQR